MSELITSDQTFDAHARNVLARIAELIIGDDPANKMPPVTDERIVQEVVQVAAAFERPIRKGLQVLQAHADELGCSSILEVSTERFEALMEGGDMRSLLRAMMQVVATAYYQDAEVLAELGFEPRPPFPQGHVVDEGDWSLLAPVRQRGPFYRKV